MTAKKKAKELVRKYWFEINNIAEDSISWRQGKKGALIAVDEILNEYWSHDTKRRDWWQEVKREIQNL